MLGYSHSLTFQVQHQITEHSFHFTCSMGWQMSMDRITWIVHKATRITPYNLLFSIIKTTTGTIINNINKMNTDIEWIDTICQAEFQSCFLHENAVAGLCFVRFYQRDMLILCRHSTHFSFKEKQEKAAVEFPVPLVFPRNFPLIKSCRQRKISATHAIIVQLCCVPWIPKRGSNLSLLHWIAILAVIRTLYKFII